MPVKASIVGGSGSKVFQYLESQLVQQEGERSLRPTYAPPLTPQCGSFSPPAAIALDPIGVQRYIRLSAAAVLGSAGRHQIDDVALKFVGLGDGCRIDRTDATDVFMT